jgi:hypothetical protein
LGEQVESSPFHEGGVDGFGSVFFHLKWKRPGKAAGAASCLFQDDMVLVKMN